MGKDDEKPPLTDSTASGGNEVKLGNRGNWGRQLDFILTCVGFAVGLGNVWRFPYLCYRNGGGAFLIPYILMLAIAGLPIFFMELAIGQFSNYGAMAVWKISPAFRGLGYASVIISWLTCAYYNVVVMWIIFYLFASFSYEVPWASCNNYWNTPNCYRRELSDLQCTNNTMANCTATRVFTGNETSPSQEYWERYVLDISSGIEELGTVRWQLVICLILAWIIVFFCLVKGIKSAGKVVYFTALFPYVVLVALLIRGATLPGASNGIYFYIVPTLEKLSDATVWKDAASQIFYSLGPAWGGLITFASYNKFHNNCYRDAVIVAVINCSTSVFAGFAIFSVIGFMAREVGKEVKDVILSGSGLAFIAYPEGISRMPAAPVWGVLFFTMLLTLGLDSQFAMMETAITGIIDSYPRQLRSKQTWVTLVVCIITFLAGIPCVTRGGTFVLTLMDWFIGAPALIIVGFFETIVVCYCYGIWNFCDDIQLMIGFKPNYYWLACWMFITPASLLFIVVMSAINYVTPYYDSNYTYPPYAEGIGWLLGTISLVFIPALFLITFISQVTTMKKLTDFFEGRTTMEVIRKMFRPPKNWGPAVGNDGLIDGVTPSSQLLKMRQEEATARTEAIHMHQMRHAAYDNPTFDSLPASLY
ncbi:sodium- and chloride-dependent glycine transporter 2-like [Lineus longissimus]|uniref:sodium- and chloride-dependent glycine transporter 2-like n=1 Tax=Lineus longissimus TaxID=88925 RepID=UPI002B4E88ED